MKHFFVLFTTCLLLSHAAFSTEAYTVLQDSVGVERWNNQSFVLYRIDPGESVYSIAQRYNVNVADIQASNPNLGMSNLLSGTVIRVPLNSQPVVEGVAQKEKRVYQVQEGDNLYRIAQQFNMDVTYLKQINRISGEVVSKGQSLIVEVPVTSKLDQQALNQQSYNNPLAPPSNPAGLPARMVERKPIFHTVKQGDYPYRLSQLYNAPIDSLRIWNGQDKNWILDIDNEIIVGYENVVGNKTSLEANPLGVPNTPAAIKAIAAPNANIEKGIGALIASDANSSDTGKSLALHRTATIGSYIKVINTNTKQETLVRVIGRIPPIDADSQIMIKISKAAGQRLGVVNDRFPVELHYNH
jgi:LysM repeat protein